MRTEGKAILDTIRTEKAISDDTKGKIKAALDTFAKTFG
jgi:F-type H+-transporting ATPase subunit alpha